MVIIKYEIKFLTYWHAGSGLTSGAQADAVVIKDENGLPYFSGKTIKGIVRDAFINLKESGLIKNQDEVDLFGQTNKSGSTGLYGGRLFFSNAEMPGNDVLASDEEVISNLFDTLASTEISSTGVAGLASLRVMEVCVPLTLEGSISGFRSKDEALDFSRLFAFIKAMGGHRNRGLGRCILQKTIIQ